MSMWITIFAFFYRREILMYTDPLPGESKGYVACIDLNLAVFRLVARNTGTLLHTTTNPPGTAVSCISMEGYDGSLPLLP